MLNDGRYRYPNERRPHRGLKFLARRMREDPALAEQLLWEELRLRRLGGHRFRRQHRIEPYITDFYCAQAKVVIEVDGENHLWRAQEDGVRDKFMLERGITVVRVANEDVLFRLEAVKKLISSAIGITLLSGGSELYTLARTD
jgi:very-short-patch-repair endonuclease